MTGGMRNAILDLRDVPVGETVNFFGDMWKVVPVNITHGSPCISCRLGKFRPLVGKCPGMASCMAHLRPDGQSVKFVNVQGT